MNWFNNKEKTMDNYPDIPAKYGITHFPSDGRYFPMMDGNFLWRGYRDNGTMETVSSPYQAIECKSAEECVAAIRRHMEWKAPVSVPRSAWK